MTPAYVNTGFRWRNNVSMAVLIVVAVYGVWQLWRAAQEPADVSATDYLFGIGFVGGAAYGLWQLIREANDRVMTFEIDPASGIAVISLWRPFWIERMKAAPGDLGNWRYHVAIVGRSGRAFFVYADHKGHPRPLQFELRPKLDLAGLRTIAPDAVAEYEGKPTTTPVQTNQPGTP